MQDTKDSTRRLQLHNKQLPVVTTNMRRMQMTDLQPGKRQQLNAKERQRVGERDRRAAAAVCTANYCAHWSQVDTGLPISNKNIKYQNKFGDW